MRAGGITHALALGTPRPAAEEVEEQNLAWGEQGLEVEDLPTTAKPGDQKEEAKRACSSGQQRSIIDVILDNSSEDRENQTTS